MIRIALFGAGRIGRMHAALLATHPDVELQVVYDVAPAAARDVADQYDAKTVSSVADALSDDKLDAVLIASSTDTHVDLIQQAAQAGKAVLCEKPIDLDIQRVEQCRQILRQHQVPVQIGFNRRFDPGHRALRDAVAKEELGQLEALIISSRDPAPPPLDYIKVSGGLFRDMMIHDFDLARFILGEEPTEISATGSVQIDPELHALGDVDSAMVWMKTASGKLCHINCSRRAVYGYDQRVEAFGEKGMLISGNHTATPVERYTEHTTAAREPLLNFFIERYQDAYTHQINAFIEAVTNGQRPTPDFEDGRRALLLADAANESLRSGQVVELSE